MRYLTEWESDEHGAQRIWVTPNDVENPAAPDYAAICGHGAVGTGVSHQRETDGFGWRVFGPSALGGRHHYYRSGSGLGTLAEAMHAADSALSECPR